MLKKLKSIFSMPIVVVLLLFFGLSCALATFIENDFGPMGARSFIYGQTWFELLMLLLTIAVIVNIFVFKMYKKDKFFLFMIHISLVFIFVGSAMTRYMGYEANITIYEGRMENKMYSSDEYIKVYKNDKLVYDKKVLMTKLAQDNFSYSTNIKDKDIEIKLNSFIDNAVERIVPSENGKPMINIIVKGFKEAKSIDLSDKQTKKTTKFLDFSLNSDKKSNKAYVNFETNGNKILYNSNLETTLFTKDYSSTKTIKANQKEQLLTDVIYKVGQTQFIINEASLKGEVKTVHGSEEIPENKRLSAVILDLFIDGKKQEISLFGKNGFTGFKRNIDIEGENLTLQWGTKQMKLPFSILLNDFRLHRYPGSNAPSAYESDIKIYDTENKNTLEYTIYMNNTLDYNGYRLFQSSYTENEDGTILLVNKDPGKVPTYIGYFLLFTGLILSLFVKKGRLKKLSSKKYDVESIKKIYYAKKAVISFILVAFSMFFIQTNSFANTVLENNPKVLNIDKAHATKFGSLLVQDYQGRIKPVNSLAIEIINKITRKSSVYGLDANQFFLSMMLYPKVWQEVDFIKVKSERLKSIVDVEKSAKTISFNDIYTKEGFYKLEGHLEIANKKKSSLRDEFDKDLIKVDERLNIAYTLFTGDFLRVFPKKGDANNKWLNTNEAVNLLISKDSEAIKNLMQDYYLKLDLATKNKTSWAEVDASLENIINYQKQNANTNVIPSDLKIKAELIFNKYNIFENLTPIYLILGFFLLVLIFVNIFKSEVKLEKISKVVLSLLVIAFIFHTLALALRWYVAGHAPWSNGYESMIYISWAIVLAGIFFSKQSVLALSTTTILSGITLFVAHLSWMEPQITTLVPVLKSYWLTIHVSVITASYGFLGLSCLLGFLCLIIFALANPKKEDDKFFNILVSIKESNRINEMSILIGLVLLVIGNFLGGIWANESWGRYWGWDPKETWTLVSIIIYAIIIHLKYIKDILSDFVFAVLTTISYASIIMTYFGVNYYLAGKHSYAAGDPVPIPTFVPVTVLVILVLVVLAYRNRKVI
ncbi:cytochrome C biogenesis protein [Arcobacter sp. CECT 8983]|uniref:cytochrome c biogenesis protein CcsA n=1 Tax=Arcobacter sp. CECT 8983 TaxID=2044508 RepID=UPI00100B8CF9|nr:cytochrome c biogenesis protein CcsA [Arcobacter sp. CECT 8983]RXJ90231.1 cytochrome C biogenesis protein [Arcobacter sp. CECT 8983]